MGTTEAARIDFRITPTRELPPGQACKLAESAGRIVASIGEDHATEAVCEELSFLHGTLTEQGRWVQVRFGDDPDRIEQPCQGGTRACVVWERVPAEVLPSRTLAAPVERDGVLVWLVHEDHVSAQLCAEMCAHGRRIAGDGLWQQRWPA